MQLALRLDMVVRSRTAKSLCRCTSSACGLMNPGVPKSPIATPPARIETERLVLRRWRVEDAPLLREAVDSSLDHLRAWMPWAVSEPATLEETESRLASYAEAFDAGADFVYGVFNERESMVVGGSGLHTRIVEGGLELGYWIRASQTKRGYATELTRALTTAGLEVPDVVRIEIHCDPRNLYSRCIPERLGYRLVETRPADKLTPEGDPRDTAVFEMTRERWEGLRHSSDAGEVS